MYIIMAGQRIVLEEIDVEFIKEYKEATGMNIQDFVREAVSEKIAAIKLNEEIKDLQRLK